TGDARRPDHHAAGHDQRARRRADRRVRRKRRKRRIDLHLQLERRLAVDRGRNPGRSRRVRDHERPCGPAAHRRTGAAADQRVGDSPVSPAVRRSLPWACALLVVLAVVAKFAWRTEPSPGPKAEDRLPPPSEKAPAAEWEAYGQTLNEIRAGKDPILQSAETKRVTRA